MKRLGIILSHPVQYFTPLFKFLTNDIDLIVFYGHQPNQEEQGRSGFSAAFSWDVDLLSGYDYVFLNNRSKTDDFNRFNGISVPDIGSVLHDHEVSHVLILGWQYRFYLQALWYCKRKGIPVAVRGDSHLNVPNGIIKKSVKRILYPIFLSLYSKLFYVGSWNKEYLVHYAVPATKLIYSPHAVDQDFWQPIYQTENNKTINFLWVGKFIDIKRPTDAIKAFQHYLSSTKHSATLTMIGSGLLLESCKKIAQNYNNIYFEGFKNQSELIEYYSASHCLILSSKSETWGLVVNEAFSCGIPAIVSDACGCAVDMIHEKTGRTYPMGDVNSLSRAMTEVSSQLERDPNFFKRGIGEMNGIHHFSGTLNAVKQFLHLPA